VKELEWCWAAGLTCPEQGLWWGDPAGACGSEDRANMLVFVHSGRGFSFQDIRNILNIKQTKPRLKTQNKTKNPNLLDQQLKLR
jgi:hypothetical protein